MTRPVRHVLSAVQLSGPEAVWVLGAHVYATLVPIVLALARPVISNLPASERVARSVV